MLAWDKLCRIYRGVMTQGHDLSRLKSSSDIYEVDKWCRVLPSSSEIFEMTPGGVASTGIFPVDIWFPRGLVVAMGDVVEVKNTRLISGTREAVTAEFVVAATTADTVVYVDDAIGFEAGDEITLTDGTNHQRVVISEIDDNAITFFDALKYDFAVGDDLESDTFYNIQSVRVPGSVGPIIETTAIVCFNTSFDD